VEGVNGEGALSLEAITCAALNNAFAIGLVGSVQTDHALRASDACFLKEKGPPDGRPKF
jgi:hypothetical protein